MPFRHPTPKREHALRPLAQRSPRQALGDMEGTTWLYLFFGAYLFVITFAWSVIVCGYAYWAYRHRGRSTGGGVQQDPQVLAVQPSPCQVAVSHGGGLSLASASAGRPPEGGATCLGTDASGRPPSPERAREPEPEALPQADVSEPPPRDEYLEDRARFDIRNNASSWVPPMLYDGPPPPEDGDGPSKEPSPAIATLGISGHAKGIVNSAAEQFRIGRTNSSAPWAGSDALGLHQLQAEGWENPFDPHRVQKRAEQCLCCGGNWQ